MAAQQLSIKDVGRLCKVCSRVLSSPNYAKKEPGSALDSGKLPTIPQICEACRKFYVRNRTRTDLVCTCDVSAGEQDMPNDSCRSCRLERCLQVLGATGQAKPSSKIPASTKPTPAAPKTTTKSIKSSTGSLPPVQTSRVDFSKIPCKVCGFSSSGIHFGVVSCEGCKIFFRRSVKGDFRVEYRCKRQGNAENSPTGLCPPSTNCRKCRLKRCIAAGMSENEQAIGRLNRETRKELDDTIAKLSAEKSILAQPVLRRSKQRTTSDSQSLSAGQASNEGQTNGLSSASSSGHSSDGEMVEMVLHVINLDCSSSASTSGNSSYEEMGYSSNQQSSFASGNQTMDCPSTSDGMPSYELNIAGEADNLLLEGFDVQPNVIYLDPLPEVDNYENTELALVGYETIPVGIMAPDDLNSLEWSLSASPYYEVLGANEMDVSRWLIDRAVDAAVKLNPISQARVVVTSREDHAVDLMTKIGQTYDLYLRSVSEFFTNLPGTNQINIQDRVVLYANAFFPIVVSQLSLQFDAEKQIPNHMSLDRNGTWQLSSMFNPWQFQMERYLIQCGNKFISTIFNLKEFALLTAMLCFNSAVDYLTDREKVEAIRSRYVLAVSHYMTENGASPERLQDFFDVVQFFSRSTRVFQCEIRAEHVQCEYFLNFSTPLFRDFRVQFVRLTPPAHCDEIEASTTTLTEL